MKSKFIKSLMPNDFNMSTTLPAGQQKQNGNEQVIRDRLHGAADITECLGQAEHDEEGATVSPEVAADATVAAYFALEVLTHYTIVHTARCSLDTQFILQSGCSMRSMARLQSATRKETCKELHNRAQAFQILSKVC